MSASITGLQLGQAILDHVQKGLHPETEEIVSAIVPPSSFEEVGRIIEHAQQELRVCGRSCPRGLRENNTVRHKSYL